MSTAYGTWIYAQADGRLLGRIPDRLSPYADCYQFPVGGGWVRLERGAYTELRRHRSDALWLFVGHCYERLAQLPGWQSASEQEQRAHEAIGRTLVPFAEPLEEPLRLGSVQPQRGRFRERTLETLRAEVPAWVRRLG